MYGSGDSLSFSNPILSALYFLVKLYTCLSAWAMFSVLIISSIVSTDYNVRNSCVVASHPSSLTFSLLLSRNKHLVEMLIDITK